MNLPLRQLLPALEKLGAQGLELEATGELAPAQLSQTGRRELRHLLRSHGLEVAAVSCPLRRGLANPDNQEARVEYLKQSLTMSYELGARVVVVEPGPLPRLPPPRSPRGTSQPEEGTTESSGLAFGPTTRAAPASLFVPGSTAPLSAALAAAPASAADDPHARLLTGVVDVLGRHGDRVGAVLALETGLDDGATVAEFLARFGTGGLGVAFNPGNLVMNGHDPIAAARALCGRIVLVHARDARATSASRQSQEVPLGRGDIDWLEMMGALAEIDYRGWLTIVRGVPISRAEAESSVQFLRRLAP